MISGFGREVAEKCALPGCYAASSGSFLPTVEDGTDRLSRNVSKNVYAVQQDTRSVFNE